MSTWILSPEPAAWLPALLKAHPDARVFAPWAVPVAPPRRLPERLQRPWRARYVSARTLWLPGWQIVEALQRHWEGGQVARRFHLLRMRRQALDRLAAACIPRDAAVVAPSFAATHLRQTAADLTVVLDLPLLSILHRDLDAAAEALPDAVFLRNYRAPDDAIEAQMRELQHADTILVRSPYVQQHLGPRAHLLTPPASPGPCRTLPDNPLLQLAGAATARNGTYTALALLDRWPTARLRIRPSEGSEPMALLRHPRVQTHGAPDAVLALAWCESTASEVRAAVAAGTPVVATKPAAMAGVSAMVDPGDVRAVVHALQGLQHPDA